MSTVAVRPARRVPFVLLAAALFGSLGLASCSSDDDETATTEPATVVEETSVADTTVAPPAPTDTMAAAVACPAVDGSSAPRRSFPAPPPMCIDAAASYRATLETTKGRIVVALDATRAPNTVNNFVFLARYHYFDGISFHRVVPGFVIQGGDPAGNGMGGPGYTFADELPSQGAYEIGSLAMANAGPDTNGSQFFIITGAQGASLPPNYSLFGKVVEGQDVVAAIDALGVGDGPPSEPVSMTTVTIAEA